MSATFSLLFHAQWQEEVSQKIPFLLYERTQWLTLEYGILSNSGTCTFSVDKGGYLIKDYLS